MIKSKELKTKISHTHSLILSLQQTLTMFVALSRFLPLSYPHDRVR